MSGKRYTKEFKVAAVNQVVKKGYSVASASKGLGITTKSLYAWIDKFGNHGTAQNKFTDQQKEIRTLKADLKRVADERDILKKAAAYFAKESL